MKIFVFEPHEWDYCGGARVVIAQSEERAHQLIWAKEKADHSGRYPVNSSWAIDTYKKIKDWSIEKDGSMFAPFSKIGDRYMNSRDLMICDRWELTHWSYVSQETEERVICDNWNYA